MICIQISVQMTRCNHLYKWNIVWKTCIDLYTTVCIICTPDLFCINTFCAHDTHISYKVNIQSGANDIQCWENANICTPYHLKHNICLCFKWYDVQRDNAVSWKTNGKISNDLQYTMCKLNIRCANWTRFKSSWYEWIIRTKILVDKS